MRISACFHCGVTFEKQHGKHLFCSDQCRFWHKVKKSGGNGCWLWTACTCGNGYGYFRLPSRQNIMAHRYSWILHNGEIPIGLDVLHDCPSGDCPSCVNPKHLWLGTQSDNVFDMVKKGRNNAAKGEHSGRSVLTDESVIEIRNCYAAGVASLTELANKFGVHPSTLSCMVSRKTWKHVQ